MSKIVDVQTATHQELLDEYAQCEDLWSQYSCDCLGYYMQALHRRIVELGGWKKLQINSQKK